MGVTEERLFTPGPTPVPPSVRDILQRPALHHRTKEFQTVLAKVTAGLMHQFQTKQPVRPVAVTLIGVIDFLKETRDPPDLGFRPEDL